MSSFGEIQAGLEKIKGHIEGQSRSINEAKEKADEGYQKLRTVHGLLQEAWSIARSINDFAEAADVIKPLRMSIL